LIQLNKDLQNVYSIEVNINVNMGNGELIIENEHTRKEKLKKINERINNNSL